MAYPWPGIREEVYVNGGAFVIGPVVTPGPPLVAMESATARNGKDYFDFLQPEIGWPVVTVKQELTFSWASMVSDDIRMANGILARAPSLVDVSIWVEISEAFWFAAGAAFAGTLKRRNVLTVVSPLPDFAATRHAVTATRGDGSALTVTLGTPDADGRTPWTAAGASVGEYVTINYTPVFVMAMVEGQQAFPQPSGHEQSQTLKFREAV